MFHRLLLRDVAIFLQKLFDGLVDLSVDFGRIRRKEFGDCGGIVVGFFFRVHFEDRMDRRLDE